MSTTQPTIITAGYVPLDIISYRKRIWHAAGGTAGNVAAVLGFMGWQSSVVADVGNDVAGHELRRDFKMSDVAVDLIRLNDRASTPRLIHEIDGDGHRYRYKCPTCNAKFPMSRPLRKDRAQEITDLDRRPDVFFFDRINAGTLLLAEHYATTGSLIVLEPSRPARPEFTKRAIDVAHVIKQSDDRDSGLNDYAPTKDQVWIITGGEIGASYRCGQGKWHKLPAFSYLLVPRRRCRRCRRLDDRRPDPHTAADRKTLSKSGRRRAEVGSSARRRQLRSSRGTRPRKATDRSRRGNSGKFPREERTRNRTDKSRQRSQVQKHPGNGVQDMPPRRPRIFDGCARRLGKGSARLGMPTSRRTAI